MFIHTGIAGICLSRHCFAESEGKRCLRLCQRRMRYYPSPGRQPAACVPAADAEEGAPCRGVKMLSRHILATPLLRYSTVIIDTAFRSRSLHYFFVLLRMDLIDLLLVIS